MVEMRGRISITAALSLACLLLLTVLPAAASQDGFRAACGQQGWYFAEGYTGGDFDTWILIQNPNQVETTAHLRFFTPDDDPLSMDLPLKGESRNTVYLNDIPELRGKEVATEVICEGEGVIAERAMYFNYLLPDDKVRAGGHASIGADQLSTSWYLPEGYTGGAFDTYLLLMNPGEEDANAYIKLLKPDDGRYYMFKAAVPAGKRKTVKIDDLVWKEGSENVIAGVQAATAGGGESGEGVEVRFDDTDVATVVYSDRGIVAERAMYFDYYGRAGGSASVGSVSTATEWYLPEGYTAGDFDTWVMAMNPSGDTVDITYTFYTNDPEAEPVSVTHYGVKPWSRDTIHVDEIEGLKGTEVSTKVTATRPVKLATAEGEEPQMFAVLFAVEDYPEGEDLLYSEDDLYDLKHALVDRCGFSYDLMRYCTAECATVQKFEEAMSWLAASAGPEDTVLFFFGGRSSKDGENRIHLYDGEISQTQLAAHFSDLATEKLVALFSCDNSGEIAQALQGPGRLLLSACDAGEEAHEYPEEGFTIASGDNGNGAFPRYFVEALGKKAADLDGDELVSAEEAFDYLEEKVTDLVQARSGEDQHPLMFDQVEGEVELTAQEVPAQIVAERSVYFNYNGIGDGHTSIGACQVYPNWFLAEGYTGGSFDTYILVMNPYDVQQKLTVTYMTPEGEPLVKEYDCPPRYRLTIKVDDQDSSLASTDVSVRVEACIPESAGFRPACAGGVVVERAMYFVYRDPGDGSLKAGGSCSIGYGSW